MAEWPRATAGFDAKDRQKRAARNVPHKFGRWPLVALVLLRISSRSVCLAPKCFSFATEYGPVESEIEDEQSRN